MKTTLTINKSEVLQEIAKTTAYLGSKLTETDGQAYDRISTTDEDEEMLERFWQECKSTAIGELRTILSSETENTTSGTYTLTLELSSAWNTGLHDSMEKSLFSFFVMGIASKWQMLANDKADASDYATIAAASIEDVKQKAFEKLKPTRPTF